MIGQNVSHYRIIDKLGAGGMGEVFLAEDTKLDRKVALKFPPDSLKENREARERLIREAKAASQLDHPNIVTIYGVEESDERHFIAMAYVQGTSLKGFCSSEPRSTDMLIDLITQASEGLKHAHDAGVVHRDLKPSNILVDTSGRVRILDFGIAKVRDATRLTQTGSTVGTLAYSSPELAQGQPAESHSDIYSLGVVMYQMLTGRLPFEAEHEAAMLYAILHEAPMPITDFNKDVPSGLQRIVFKCLEKQPEERYSSCAQLVADLRAVSTQGIRDAPRDQEDRVRPSIAVLPFANMSTDPDNEFFSDGLAEEIINALTKAEDLRVVARTSAFSFKGKEVDVREIGRKLNVDSILEGSVRRSGTRLRVTAQLVKTSDGYHLWSERYDREMSDVFEIQDEITHAIVDNLKVRLLGDSSEAIAQHRTNNVEALTLYMKGRFYWNKRTEENFRKSIGFYEQALQLDPDYAMAHVGIADAYNLYGFYNLLPPRETFARARESALRALELDEKLAAAHTSLAYAKFYHDWEWEEAEASFRKAQLLDPNYAFAFSFHGNFLVALGRFDEALVQWHRGFELDPLAIIQNAGNGWAVYHMRQYDDAIERLRNSLDMDPSFMVAHVWLARAYEQVGRLDEAQQEFDAAMKLSERMPGTLAELGRVQAVAGHHDSTDRILAELDTMSGVRYVLPVDLALLHAARGDLDRAFEYMNQALEDRSPDLVVLNVEPRFDVLRSDPRFARLVKEVGLPS